MGGDGFFEAINESSIIPCFKDVHLRKSNAMGRYSLFSILKKFRMLFECQKIMKQLELNFSQESKSFYEKNLHI